jgi:hypothetical protein
MNNVKKLSINFDQSSMKYIICMEKYDLVSGDFEGVVFEFTKTFDKFWDAEAEAYKLSKDMGIELLPFHNTDYVG